MVKSILSTFASTFCLCLLLGCSGEGQAAPAQASPTDQKKAKELFAEGNALMLEYWEVQKDAVRNMFTQINRKLDSSQSTSPPTSEPKSLDNDLANMGRSVAQQQEELAKQALEKFEEAGRLDPQLADAFFSQGMAYHFLQDPARAAEARTQAIEILRHRLKSRPAGMGDITNLLPLMFAQEHQEQIQQIVRELKKLHPQAESTVLLQNLYDDSLKKQREFQDTFNKIPSQ